MGMGVSVAVGMGVGVAVGMVVGVAVAEGPQASNVNSKINIVVDTRNRTVDMLRIIYRLKDLALSPIIIENVKQVRHIRAPAVDPYSARAYYPPNLRRGQPAWVSLPSGH